MNVPNAYDVFVVGAGHAGCEAALAAARMGGRVALCTLSRDKIAEMPCNPAVGGLAKSHLVREIDALGGAMGRVIDRTGIQFRLLNRGKGPAVRAPRAQADKHLYKSEMRRVIEATPGIDLIEAEVKRVTFRGSRVTGVVIDGDVEIPIGAIVITTGTFLYGLMHIGDRDDRGRSPGRATYDGAVRLHPGSGAPSSARFKTGTPPRLSHRSKRFDYASNDRAARRGLPAPRVQSLHPEPVSQRADLVLDHAHDSSETARGRSARTSDRSPLFSGQHPGRGAALLPVHRGQGT